MKQNILLVITFLLTGIFITNAQTEKEKAIDKKLMRFFPK